MNKLSSLLLSTLLLTILVSCSSTQTPMAPITPAANGLMTGKNLSFPLLLTKEIKTKEEIIKETSDDVFIIYIGHLLDASKSKKENEKKLKELEKNDYDLVNLNIEDILIAEIQGLSFDHYKLSFLNSSVIDIKKDNLFRTKRVVPFVMYRDTVFVGLSDNQTTDSLLNNDLTNSFIVNDYVLSILQARKLAMNDLKNLNKKLGKKEQKNIKSFVIVHDLGTNMTEVMDRLPPHFLTN